MARPYTAKVTDAMARAAHLAYFADDDEPSRIELDCMRNAVAAALEQGGLAVDNHGLAYPAATCAELASIGRRGRARKLKGGQ